MSIMTSSMELTSIQPDAPIAITPAIKTDAQIHKDAMSLETYLDRGTERNICLI